MSAIAGIGPRDRVQLRLASEDAMILAGVDERAIAANANAKALGSPDCRSTLYAKSLHGRVKTPSVATFTSVGLLALGGFVTDKLRQARCR